MATFSFGAHQVKVKPRPLVGTKTFILKMQRRMRDVEWSDAAAPMIEALRDNGRRALLPATTAARRTKK